MTGGMSLAVEKIIRDVDTQHIDSISVSSGGDTLFVGPGSAGFDFLAGKTTTFTAQKPYIDGSDTLTKAIGVIIAINYAGLTDSTNLVIVPRAQ